MEIHLRKKTLRLLIPLVVAVIAGGVWFVYRNPPEACAWYPRCVFHAVTGLLCPGCGSTRAVYHLLHGDLLPSLRCNLLIYVFACISPVILLKPKHFALPGAFFLLTFAAAYAVLRNMECGFSQFIKP